jgi:hypothetical protein
MFLSARFWIPFILSLLIEAVFVLSIILKFAVIGRWGEDNTQIGRALFPYTFLAADLPKTFVESCSPCITVGLWAFLLQIPLYGFLIGLALFKKRPYIIGILLGLHIIVYLVALWFRQS